MNELWQLTKWWQWSKSIVVVVVSLSLYTYSSLFFFSHSLRQRRKIGIAVRFSCSMLIFWSDLAPFNISIYRLKLTSEMELAMLMRCAFDSYPFVFLLIVIIIVIGLLLLFIYLCLLFCLYSLVAWTYSIISIFYIVKKFSKSADSFVCFFYFLSYLIKNKNECCSCVPTSHVPSTIALFDSS